MDRQFNTPHRGQDQKDIAQTGIKHDVAQSQYQEEEQKGENKQEQQPSLQESLNNVQADIKAVQERLRDIAERKRQHDEDSQQYAKLQEQRTHFRKQLIDLDHQHKVIFLAYKRKRDIQSKIQSEQTERRIVQQQEEIRRAYEEERLQRSRRLEEQTRQIQQSARKRRQELNKLYEKHASPKKAEPQISQVREQIGQSHIEEGSQVKGSGSGQVKQKTQQQKLAQQKYNARVAEIEAQLASERLRRSRQIQLEAELIRIRQWTPYHWYSYTYPSLLYPLAPSYSLYPYYRYPFYDPLLNYPYSYYPYRSRFSPYYSYI